MTMKKRKIGRRWEEGERKEKKRGREEEKNFSPSYTNVFAHEETREKRMESFFHPLSLVAAEEEQDCSDERTFHHAQMRVCTQEAI